MPPIGAGVGVVVGVEVGVAEGTEVGVGVTVAGAGAGGGGGGGVAGTGVGLGLGLGVGVGVAAAVIENVPVVPCDCPVASMKSVSPVPVVDGFTSWTLARMVRVSDSVVCSADSTIVTVRAAASPVTDVGVAPSRPVQLVAVIDPLKTVQPAGNVSTMLCPLGTGLASVKATVPAVCAPAAVSLSVTAPPVIVPPSYRANAKSPLESPAATILPSDWITTALVLVPAPMSVNTLPSPLKVVSRPPLLLNRASANVPSQPPTATILPSACMATSWAKASARSMVTIPSPSKVVSRLPSLLYRAKANSSASPALTPPETTILPSDWIATATPSADVPMVVVTRPSPSKVESKVPVLLYRASANFPSEPPATTILSSDWIATALVLTAVPMAVNTLPSPSKVVSKVPVLLNRASENVPSEPPTATILPSACMATSCAKASARSMVTIPSPSKVVSRLPLLLYRAKANS